MWRLNFRPCWPAAPLMNACLEIMPFAWASDAEADAARPQPAPLNPLAQPAWDAFVAAQADATPFHTVAWARVLHETYGYQPCYFCRTGGAGLEQALPLMEVRSPWTGARGVSLPFTDECPLLGPATADAAPLYAAALEYGRTRRWKYLEIRDTARQWPGATPSVAFYRHQLDLTHSETQLFAGLEGSMRRGIRKAEAAGVRVEASTSAEAVRDYYRLHCLTRRRHGLPPQPFRFFAQLGRHLLAPGQGRIFTAWHEQRPIAAAVFLRYGRQVLYKFGASDYAFQDLRPNPLVMWRAIQWAAATGGATLHFGRTSLANAGLRRFKRGFGAVEDQIHYIRFDYAAGRFVTQADHAHHRLTPWLQRLPLPLLRGLGALLYPHLA